MSGRTKQTANTRHKRRDLCHLFVNSEGTDQHIHAVGSIFQFAPTIHGSRVKREYSDNETDKQSSGNSMMKLR